MIGDAICHGVMPAAWATTISLSLWMRLSDQTPATNRASGVSSAMTCGAPSITI